MAFYKKHRLDHNRECRLQRLLPEYKEYLKDPT